MKFLKRILKKWRKEIDDFNKEIMPPKRNDDKLCRLKRQAAIRGEYFVH